jgi:phospholipase C
MDSRREFLKKASVLTTGSSLLSVLPASIQKALAINPDAGTTFLDAEHVVILMQENRSFDHTFGTLQGVRGFNDPRAIRQSNGNKVWLQTDDSGNTNGPFRLNMEGSNATWIYSLPHSWENQVEARNRGWHNRWLQSKQSGMADYKDIPLTLGYYNREDIPFYYALADAFTICDQHFCSSLTGTTPNRLYLWSGTLREKPDFESKANVKNEDVDYEKWAKWKTFPERLEENGVSWKIYQNEISVPTGLEGEKDGLLGNFTDNPIEWFENYKVKFHPEYREYMEAAILNIPKEIEELEKKLSGLSGKEADDVKGSINWRKKHLDQIKKDIKIYTNENFDKLTDFQKNIHKKAFTNNRGDADYHNMEEYKYSEKGKKRTVNLPKGDLLYQFRKDVNERNLPTVSWVVAPEKFSDHPDAPWYGAWYVSEVLDILTKNPEVWKKTIFILTYDENDGQFDHVPPFVAAHHEKENTGKASAGIDLSVEQVNIKHEKMRPYKNPEKEAKEDAIGLGYRVPLVIASPWSRGGKVSSEVYDHTSVLQFLEFFLKNKTKKEIKESNISAWRRTVCGDLTSVFKPYSGEKTVLPKSVDKEPFIQRIFESQFKEKPSGFREFTKSEISKINAGAPGFDWGAVQEKGIRPACPSFYELYAEAEVLGDQLRLNFESGRKAFGEKANGSPFMVYTSSLYGGDWVPSRNYALKAGDKLNDEWDLKKFKPGQAHVEVYGPNGFYRSFKNLKKDIRTSLKYEFVNEKITGNVFLEIKNDSDKTLNIKVEDVSYRKNSKSWKVEAGSASSVRFDLSKYHNWYDLRITADEIQGYEVQYAGHVDTGKESFTDPAMGGII